MNDGKRYLVRSNANSKIHANILSILAEKKINLLKHLKKQKKYKNHTGVQRLISNEDVVIEEVAAKYEKEAAYSINKGERIGICLRDKKTGEIENENEMFFVLIHELAHIMTDAYKHNQQFWKNMSLLIENAIEAKLYNYVNYKSKPTMYCGHLISHSPYVK